jgi:hypothetical protein
MPERSFRYATVTGLVTAYVSLAAIESLMSCLVGMAARPTAI